MVNVDESRVVDFHPQRWQPDEALRFAALDGRVCVTELPKPDRAWLVAVLTHGGMTTDTIAEKLHCSRRTVQQIRCEPVAVLVTKLLVAEAESQRAVSRMKAVATAGPVTALVHENDALRQAKWALVEQLSELRRRCQTVACPPPIMVMHPPKKRKPKRYLVVVETCVPMFEVVS